MKYLALDIGNVLVKVDIAEFLNTLSSTFNMPIEDCTRFLTRFQKPHDLGLTTMRRELEDRFDIGSDDLLVDELLACWDRSLTLNSDMITMLSELKKEVGLEIALLSNIGVEHAELIKNMLSYDECGFYFNHEHFSCEVGARKPTKLFYQSFLMQYPDFHGCLYVDDLQENLDAADIFGFRTQLFSLHDPDLVWSMRELKREISGDNNIFRL